MYPVLEKKYKGSYPFKLASTSFIYPDTYVPNVRMLGPYFDEIELLFYEGSPREGLPPKGVIRELSELSKGYDLSYSVHLPIDLSLGDRDPSRRQAAVETIKRMMDLTLPLSPSTSILHIPPSDESGRGDSVKRWQDRVSESLGALTASVCGKELSVENLNYPLEWIEAIIRHYDLSLCIDIGHLVRLGLETRAIFDRHSERISTIHLHGVERGRDHKALPWLPEKEMDQVLEILRTFTGSVSLEVFSFADLDASVRFLEQKCREG